MARKLLVLTAALTALLVTALAPLKALFATAVEDDLLDANPAAGVRVPRVVGQLPELEEEKAKAKRAGVPGARLKPLRHTCASILFRQGCNAKQVQVWLGHHSAAFTRPTSTCSRTTCRSRRRSSTRSCSRVSAKVSARPAET